ncbi:MAG: hypothetical protein ACI4II_05580 [Acutalibacteraceae bacterium]
MSYVYATMWLIIGIYLFYMGHKSSSLLKFLSLYFFFSAIWWFVDAATPLDMFVSPYSWIFRGVSCVVLVIAVISMYTQRKELAKAFKSKENKGNSESPEKNVKSTDNK